MAMRAAWSTLLVPVLLASLVLQGDGNEATHAAATLPVEPWAPATSATATVQDLHREYDQVFKHGNRNAASHRWSSFLLDRAGQMTAERLNMLFSGFCAVSGSIVNPNDYNRYRLTLPKVGGGYSTGYMHYCCWPCVCDTQDFIRVDTKNVTSSDATRTLEFAVIGNPCDHPEKLHEPFMDLRPVRDLDRGVGSGSALPSGRCAGGGDDVRPRLRDNQQVFRVSRRIGCRRRHGTWGTGTHRCPDARACFDQPCRRGVPRRARIRNHVQ
jgi:hypothetical protein